MHNHLFCRKRKELYSLSLRQQSGRLRSAGCKADKHGTRAQNRQWHKPGINTGAARPKRAELTELTAVRPRFRGKNAAFPCAPTSKRAEPSEAVTGPGPRYRGHSGPGPHPAPPGPDREASAPAAAPHPAGPAAPPAQTRRLRALSQARPSAAGPSTAQPRPQWALPAPRAPGRCPSPSPWSRRRRPRQRRPVMWLRRAHRPAPPPRAAHWPAPRKGRAALPLAEPAVIGGAGGQWAASAPGAAGNGARGRAGHGGPAGPGRARPAQVPLLAPRCPARSWLPAGPAGPARPAPPRRARHRSSARLEWWMRWKPWSRGLGEALPALPCRAAAAQHQSRAAVPLQRPGPLGRAAAGLPNLGSSSVEHCAS